MSTSSRILTGFGLFLGITILVTGLSASSAPATDKKAVDGATKPIGPYSAGVDVGSLVFVAGQIGMDPATGKFVEGGIEAQTAQVMKNAEAVLKNAGLGFENVVRTTVYLADIADFQAMNKVYATFFPEGSVPPARSTIGVARFPRALGSRSTSSRLAEDDREEVVLEGPTRLEREAGKRGRRFEGPKREDGVVPQPARRDGAPAESVLRRARGAVERLHVEEDGVSGLHGPGKDFELLTARVDVGNGLVGLERSLVGPMVHELPRSEELSPAV
jgi:2-iminobutanoate/2-iminopropanoate deaminase